MKQIIEQDTTYKKIKINIQNQQVQIPDLKGYGTYKLELSETKKYRQFNNYINTEKQKISEQFPQIIDVRGDGNCFYRSIILSFIFQIFKPSENQMYTESQIRSILRFLGYVDNLENCINKYHMNLPYKFKDDQILDFKNLFLQNMFYLLNDLQEGKNVLEDVIGSLNNYAELDFACVIVCRYMIFKQFLLHKSNPSLNQFRDEEVKNYIQQLLLQYGTQAEDMIIKLAAQAFQCNLIVQNLYQLGSNVINNKLIFKPLYEYNQIDLNVPILYTNGHYMCLVDLPLEKICKNAAQEEKYSTKQLNHNYESNQSKSQYFSIPQDEMEKMFNDQSKYLQENNKLIEKYKTNKLCFSKHTDLSIKSVEAFNLKYIKIEQYSFIFCQNCQQKIQTEYKEEKKKTEIKYFHLKNEQLDKLLVFEYNQIQK
ncbi:hypothetical protein ABPG74_001890 [Tetrahymena malaccensis]